MRLSPKPRAGSASPQRLVVYPRAERKRVCHGPKRRGQIHVTFVVFARKSGLFFPVFRGLRRAEMILTPRAVRLLWREGLQRKKAAGSRAGGLVVFSALREGCLLPLADVDEVAGNGGSRGHGR